MLFLKNYYLQFTFDPLNLPLHCNRSWITDNYNFLFPSTTTLISCVSLNLAGWFTLLNPDGRECAMTLTSMGQVAAARVPAFLTKFDVPVYKLTESNGKTKFSAPDARNLQGFMES